MKKIFVLLILMISFSVFSAEICEVYIDKTNESAWYYTSAVCTKSQDGTIRSSKDYKDARLTKVNVIQSLVNRGYKLVTKNTLILEE